MPRLDCRGPDRIRQWRRDLAARGLGRKRARELGVDDARLRRVGLGKPGTPRRTTAPAATAGSPTAGVGAGGTAGSSTAGGTTSTGAGRAADVSGTRGVSNGCGARAGGASEVAGGALGPAGDGLSPADEGAMARGMTGDAPSSVRRASDEP